MTGSPGYEPEGEGTGHLEKEKEKTQKKKHLLLADHCFQRVSSFKPGLKSGCLEGKVRWHHGLEERASLLPEIYSSAKCSFLLSPIRSA